MNRLPLTRRLATPLAALTLALAGASATAQPAPPPSAPAAPPHAVAQDRPHDAGTPGWKAGHPGGPAFHRGLPGLDGRLLHKLDLSEAQQDQIFLVRHAQQPAERLAWREQRKLRQALRDVTLATPYDEAKAQTLAQELGKQEAASALRRSATTAKILAVLTPAQREQLQAWRAAPRQARGAHEAPQTRPQTQPTR